MTLTSRQEELSQSKKVNADFRGDRPTAVWPISRAALNAEASSRVKELAQPRPFIDDWALSRPRFPLVSKGALNATPSQRVIALATPRSLPVSPLKKPPKKTPRGPIANVAKFEELSKPRIYMYESHNPYKVSKAALQYVPSSRILEISRPVRMRAKAAHIT
ncbi:sperm microtubule associated protein 2 [Pogona vitticeps]